MTNLLKHWHLARQLLSARFSGYAMVGALGTLVHWLIYAGLVLVMVAPVIATTVGALAGACVNYGLNLKFVFRPASEYRHRALKFMVVAGIGMLINGAVVNLLQGIDPWFAQLCATLVVLAAGYWLNARWTFR